MTTSNSNNRGRSQPSLYSSISKLPLIKSPSAQVPPPIQLPKDIHPLPQDVRPYFVYPFSLESYVLSPSAPSSSTISQLYQRHERYLEEREAETRERERQALRRIAPGWSEGDHSILTPQIGTRANPSKTSVDAASPIEPLKGSTAKSRRFNNDMDDMIDTLAHLDSLDDSPP
ncbi:hypothetical protein IE53DRAFT_385815 [Violaceomyces palustris]|uniref:Uncharacterized protein n=1 Tax=Violaceomyces palustris TaxID=1673888 RepID=A0ACD0P140_9BASI|nr:hypothetical protein IE53DRAFT_385815 [Violaceomyces palustris]